MNQINTIVAIILNDINIITIISTDGSISVIQVFNIYCIPLLSDFERRPECPCHTSKILYICTVYSPRWAILLTAINIILVSMATFEDIPLLHPPHLNPILLVGGSTVLPGAAQLAESLGGALHWRLHAACVGRRRHRVHIHLWWRFGIADERQGTHRRGPRLATEVWIYTLTGQAANSLTGRGWQDLRRLPPDCWFLLPRWAT